MKNVLLALLVLILIIAGWAIWYNQQETAPNQEVVQAPCTPNSSGVLTVLETAEGKYYADANCRALYVFADDEVNESSCNNDCAVNWPPYVYDSKDVVTLAENDPLAKNINIIQRSDDSYQYAYGNKALYYYHEDKSTGDTKGVMVNEKWSLLPADGQ